MENEFYDEYSDISEWHWWYEGRKSIILGLLSKHIKPKSRVKILDIGCGPGGMINSINLYGETYGIDCNAKSIKKCRDKGFSHICLSDVENIPFKRETFAIVLILDVFEHLNSEEKLLKESMRVCAKDGIILITVPAFKFLWGDQDIISHHKRRYKSNDLKKIIKSQDLYMTKISYFNFILFPLVTLIRLFKRIIPSNNQEIKSDFTFNKPGYINNFFSMLFQLESRFIPFISFPFGSSIICLLKKNDI